MLAQTARIAVVATVFAAAFSQARAQAPSTAAPPAPSMIVLHNGEVIAGKITKMDDVYLVDLPYGRIRVKQSDVDLVCSNLDEGYRLKRNTIQIGNVHDHLELAQWCLRHNLMGQASVELADAASVDPKNPMVAALQHRLKMAMEPPAPAGEKAPATLPSGPSSAELDRMLRGMPRGAVESFTQSVQPVLLNQCATSGCHGPQAEAGLRLYRVSGGAATSRRSTQRNLYSVLKYIDLANPSESRLLTAARKPHGTVQHAIFTERQAGQYQRIAEWANQLAGRPTERMPASVARKNGPAEVTEPQFDDQPATLPREANKAQRLNGAKTPRTARRPGTPSRNADDPAPASFDQPSDSQDPEVFNRQYGQDKPTAPPKKPAKSGGHGPLQELLPLRGVQGN
jgi:hypothetical protein